MNNQSLHTSTATHNEHATVSFDRTHQGNTIPIMPDDRYTLERVLGEGSFGIVYYAYDHKLCKYWAVKVMPLGNSFETEALKKIDNYAFPRIVDTLCDETYNYLIMDYIEGTPLDKYLATHIMSEKEILLFATKIARALDYLHHLTPCMIYMDCKPSNIIVTPQKDIRLVDMGSIYVCDTPGQRRSGTGGYAPGEITSMENDNVPTPATDIYCLGKTMYKMLTQSNKEYRDRLGNLSVRHRNKKISRQTEMIVRRCTCPDMKKRYQSMSELINDIEKAKKKRMVNIISPFQLLSNSFWILFDIIAKGILAAAILYCSYSYKQLETPYLLSLIYLMAIVFLLLCRNKHIIVTETKTDLFKTSGPRILLSVIICTLCTSVLIYRVSASDVTPASKNSRVSLTDEVDILPITLYDECERKLLISHGTCWETCEDIKMSIPIDEIGPSVNTITVICETPNDVKSYSFEVSNSNYVNH